MKLNIEVDLPKIELQLKSTGVIVDCGKLVVNVPEEGCYEIPLRLTNLNIELVNEKNKTRFIPEISTNIKFIREFKEVEHQDTIKF